MPSVSYSIGRQLRCVAWELQPGTPPAAAGAVVVERTYPADVGRRQEEAAVDTDLEVPASGGVWQPCSRAEADTARVEVDIGRQEARNDPAQWKEAEDMTMGDTYIETKPRSERGPEAKRCESGSQVSNGRGREAGMVEQSPDREERRVM